MAHPHLETLEGRHLPSFAGPVAVVPTPPNGQFLVDHDDLNHDGHPDLSLGDGTVLPGLAGGTFGPALGGNLQPGGTVKVLGDFNGDGKADRIIGAWEGGFRVQLGNGDGTFQDGPTSAGLAAGQGSPVAGDFDGDGKLDLGWQEYPPVYYTPYTVNGCVPPPPGCAGSFITDPGTPPPPPTLKVALGNGDGTFQDPVTSPSPAMLAEPSQWRVADVTGDGRADVVAYRYQAGDVVVLAGQADGTMGPATPLATGLQAVTGVTVADVTGDGRADLVFGGTTGDDSTGVAGHVGVLAGQSGGTFAAPILSDVKSTPNGPMVVADFNHDGKVDLVTGTGDVNGQQMLFLAGQGTGAFGAGQAFWHPGSGGPVPTAFAADVNGDGKLDLVAEANYAGTVAVFLGNGDGSFQNFTEVPGGEEWVLGDLNGDGKPDRIGVGGNNGPTVSVALNHGDGTFDPNGTVDLGAAVGPVKLADVNGDGKLDLVAAKVSFGDPADTADLRVALGHGDGTFGPVQVSPLAPNLGVFTLQTADLDGDGKLDVVGLSGRYDDATSSYQSSVTVVRGNGDGTFQAPAVLPVAAGPQGLAIGDLDGDGRPELVLLAADGTGKVQAVVWHNTGAPGTVAFTPAAAPALDGPNGYGSDLALADVDGDGKLDLLATYTTYGTSATTSALAVALGHGDGTFGAPDTQGVNSYGPFLRLLPGTAGHPDLAVGSGEGAVTVWHNDGAGHFTPGAPVFTDGWNWQVADLNGDGKADLVVSAWGGTGVTHHLLFGV